MFWVWTKLSLDCRDSFLWITKSCSYAFTYRTRFDGSGSEMICLPGKTNRAISLSSTALDLSFSCKRSNVNVPSPFWMSLGLRLMEVVMALSGLVCWWCAIKKLLTHCWRLWWQSKKTCKALVSWSPPTNQHFAHIRGPSIKRIDDCRCWLMTMLGNGMVYWSLPSHSTQYRSFQSRAMLGNEQ